MVEIGRECWKSRPKKFLTKSAKRLAHFLGADILASLVL